MLKNYILTGIRNILRSRTFSVINISGLSVGIASVILIMLWVRDELSYDRFHTNGDRIYRVITKFGSDPNTIWTTSPFPLGRHMADRYPEIESYTRYWNLTPLVKYGNTSSVENDFRLVDQDFLDMFSFRFLKGNKNDALKSKNSVIITESVAKKYFGDVDPVGKVLTVNRTEFLTVTGLMKDPPENTVLKFSMLANVESIPRERLESWSFDTKTFIQLKEGVHCDEFQSKIDSLYRDILPNSSAIPFLQNLEEIYLNENGRPVRLIFVKAFSLTALLILLLACINYMNLSTARSVRRSREIGIRKVTGAGKGRIIMQFLSESFLTTLISMIFALVLVEMIRPAFNSLVMKNIRMDYGDPFFIAGILIVLVFTGLSSGLYPAFVMSSYSPVRTIRGIVKSGRSYNRLINSLVIIQFTVAFALIIISLTIGKQIRYINSKELGLNKDNILVIPYVSEIRPFFDIIKDEILKNPSVVSVTAAYNLPTDHNSYVGLNWEGNPGDESIGIFYNMVDYDFVETMGMQLTAGRSFSEDFSEDDSISYIINESAREAMNMFNPIGKEVMFIHPDFPERFRKGRIIGVVKDFHLRPLREEISPFAMRMYRPWYNHILIKYNTDNIQGLIEYLEEIAKKYLPDYQFTYTFYEQTLRDLYMVEYKAGRIALCFTILSIIISCIGLLGLTINELDKKTKEIGIRKAFGSTTDNLLLMFGISFLKRLFISFIVGSVIAKIAAGKILEQYAYKTDLTAWLFFDAFIIVVATALLTIMYQTYVTSAKNPAESLRYE